MGSARGFSGLQGDPTGGFIGGSEPDVFRVQVANNN